MADRRYDYVPGLLKNYRRELQTPPVESSQEAYREMFSQLTKIVNTPAIPEPLRNSASGLLTTVTQYIASIHPSETLQQPAAVLQVHQVVAPQKEDDGYLPWRKKLKIYEELFSSWEKGRVPDFVVKSEVIKDLNNFLENDVPVGIGLKTYGLLRQIEDFFDLKTKEFTVAETVMQNRAKQSSLETAARLAQSQIHSTPQAPHGGKYSSLTPRQQARREADTQGEAENRYPLNNSVRSVVPVNTNISLRVGDIIYVEASGFKDFDLYEYLGPNVVIIKKRSVDSNIIYDEGGNTKYTGTVLIQTAKDKTFYAVPYAGDDSPLELTPMWSEQLAIGNIVHISSGILVKNRPSGMLSAISQRGFKVFINGTTDKPSYEGGHVRIISGNLPAYLGVPLDEENRPMNLEDNVDRSYQGSLRSRYKVGDVEPVVAFDGISPNTHMMEARLRDGTMVGINKEFFPDNMLCIPRYIGNVKITSLDEAHNYLLARPID